MKKLFLHVGMPKTGSSYIQSVFNKNSIVIKNDLATGLLNNITPHQLACKLIKDDSPLVNRIDIKVLRNCILDTILEKLKIEASKEICFISSEYFILPNKEDIVNFFKNYFDEINIIYVVRRQDKLLASGYNQDIKALNRSSNLTWNGEHEPHLNYFENCMKWKELGCNVHVIDYDSVKNKENNYLNKFLEILNLQKNKIVTPENKMKINTSLTKDEVILKLAKNRNNKLSDELLSKYTRELKNKDEFSLPKHYEDIIRRYYSSSNKMLVDNFLNNDKNSPLLFDINKEKNEISEFSWDPLEYSQHIIDFFLEEKK